MLRKIMLWLFKTRRFTILGARGSVDPMAALMFATAFVTIALNSVWALLIMWHILFLSMWYFAILPLREDEVPEDARGIVAIFSYKGKKNLAYWFKHPIVWFTIVYLAIMILVIINGE